MVRTSFYLKKKKAAGRGCGEYLDCNTSGERCLEVVMGWMWDNSLELNSEKTEVLYVSNFLSAEVGEMV